MLRDSLQGTSSRKPPELESFLQRKQLHRWQTQCKNIEIDNKNDSDILYNDLIWLDLNKYLMASILTDIAVTEMIILTSLFSFFIEKTTKWW